MSYDILVKDSIKKLTRTSPSPFVDRFYFTTYITPFYKKHWNVGISFTSSGNNFGVAYVLCYGKNEKKKLGYSFESCEPSKNAVYEATEIVLKKFYQRLDPSTPSTFPRFLDDGGVDMCREITLTVTSSSPTLDLWCDGDDGGVE